MFKREPNKHTQALAHAIGITRPVWETYTQGRAITLISLIEQLYFREDPNWDNTIPAYLSFAIVEIEKIIEEERARGGFAQFYDE